MSHLPDDARQSRRGFIQASTGLADAGVGFSFNLSESGDRVFSEAKTATTTARIIEQSGFDS
jgi:hypothetical protein